MLTSLPVSAMVGSPLAGWLLGTSFLGLKGWQTLFVVEGVPAVICGVGLWLWLADWPSEARWLSVAERRRLMQAYEAEVEAKRSRKSYTVWQALGDPEVLRLCLVYFLWITGYWGFNFWTPTVVREGSGWSPLRVGWMLVIPMALALVAMVGLGWSSARTGEKRWHGAVPLFLAALGMGVGVWSRDPFWGFVGVCLAGMGVYGPFGVWWSYPTTFLSGAAAAGAVGLINSAGNVGGFLGPYATGWIKAATGSVAVAFLGLAGSLLAAGVLLLTLRANRNGAGT